MADPSVAQGGVLNPGWQYPTLDPLNALINALQSQGRFIDVFNPSLMKGMSQAAGGLLPQFLSTQLGAGDLTGEDNFGTRFGDFLNNMTRGKSTIPSFGMGAAGDFLGKYSDALRGVKEQIGGLGLNTDWADPASRRQAIAQAQAKGTSAGGISALQAALAGLGLGDSNFQQKLYLLSLGSSLGPDLTEGLRKVTGAQADAWGRGLETAMGLEGRPASFLDMLLGRLGQIGPGVGNRQGYPGGGAATGTAATGTGAGSAPGSTAAALGLAPSSTSEALSVAPRWDPQLSTAPGRGHVPFVGMEQGPQRMLGSPPTDVPQPSFLWKLLELLNKFPGMLQLGQATPGQQYQVGPVSGRGF